jgi:hypothetical protein
MAGPSGKKAIYGWTLVNPATESRLTDFLGLTGLFFALDALPEFK